MIPCKGYTMLWDVMDEIHWKEDDSQVILFSEEVRIYGWTKEEDNVELKHYFNRCTKGKPWKIDFTVGEPPKIGSYIEWNSYDIPDDWDDDGEDDPEYLEDVRIQAEIGERRRLEELKREAELAQLRESSTEAEVGLSENPAGVLISETETAVTEIEG
jgi:hypothetical protein